MAFVKSPFETPTPNENNQSSINISKPMSGQANMVQAQIKTQVDKNCLMGELLKPNGSVLFHQV